MHTTIGIDLGGTRIKAVVIDQEGKLLHQRYAETRDGADAVWKQVVKETVAELKAVVGEKDIPVGISAPGLPNADNTAIAHMPGRMDGLEGFNWSQHLQSPAWVLNDAVAAMMAEAGFGVAKGRKHVVMLTLGTGVGGAILIDGRPYQGAFGKAGHIGHMVIDDEGECDVTGMPGSLEDCIGNCTIEKRSKVKFNSTAQLVEAYRAGDEWAKEVWLRSIKQLAIGLASVTNILSPELIVLGGGITTAGADLFEPLEKYMAGYEWRAGGHSAKIVQAGFGDMAGAIGAGYFASQKTNY